MPLEVLVYNVTHSDVVLGVEDPSPRSRSGTETETETRWPRTLFARPRFSAYGLLRDAWTRAGADDARGVEATLQVDVADPATPRAFGAPPRGEVRLPVGFEVDAKATWGLLHLRASATPPAAAEEEASIKFVFLPLAAQLIPAWSNRADAFESPSPPALSENAPKEATSQTRKHVLLVCGAGRPQNAEESMASNSTRDVAFLIQRFLCRFHGFREADVQVIDSGWDVFSYDENVVFMRQHLLPPLERIRRAACAEAPNHEWRANLEVTMALTEGSPARLAALSAALRPYRPYVAHMWQLKTFWHERRLLASDVLFHSFDRVDTTPPMAVRALSADVRALVAEVLRYKAEFEALDKPELDSFWLRKSKKPVLSVLSVRRRSSSSGAGAAAGAAAGESSDLVFYRGLNLEVSQPTGSLCSERNAIGSALAAEPDLFRERLVMIAVLSLPPLRPRVVAASAAVAVVDAAPAPSPSLSPGTSTATTRSASGSGSVAGGTSSPPMKRMRSESMRPLLDVDVPAISLAVSAPAASDSTSLAASASASMFAEGGNPLGPCGACNEWLKKIYEVNPDFRVVTFTDTSCRFAYVREVF